MSEIINENEIATSEVTDGAAEGEQSPARAVVLEEAVEPVAVLHLQHLLLP